MKTIKHVIYLFILLSFMTNCNKKTDKVEVEFKLAIADNIDSNEYQIYSLILKEKFTTSNNLVIEQKTTGNLSISFGNIYFETLKTENQNLDTTIFNDFINKNNTVYNLDNKFIGSTKSITLISSEEINYLFNSQDINKAWNEFYEKYPKSNGMIKFSRVGFNSDKSQGIVEIGHYYASLGSDGSLVYLVKENNSWRIIKFINTWIS
ncbi:MAG: hypothetical protein ACOYO1_17535 [Bacteroidales bacterium]